MPALTYLRFDRQHHGCDCCGRVIRKGTVILSDGRRYGPDCAARAMGRPKATSRDRALVERLRAEAERQDQQAAWTALAADRGAWTWLGKGRAPFVGEDYTAWRLPDGREVIEATSVIDAFPVVARDHRSRTTLYLATAAGWCAANEYIPAHGWTADRHACWIPRQGWAA